MVHTITLPRVVVTRIAAEDVVRDARLPAGGDVVKVLARGVASSAQSFADELIQQLLANGYHTMILLGAPRQLFADLSKCAARTEGLKIRASASDLVGS